MFKAWRCVDAGIFTCKNSFQYLLYTSLSSVVTVWIRSCGSWIEAASHVRSKNGVDGQVRPREEVSFFHIQRSQAKHTLSSWAQVFISVNAPGNQDITAGLFHSQCQCFRIGFIIEQGLGETILGLDFSSPDITQTTKQKLAEETA